MCRHALQAAMAKKTSKKAPKRAVKGKKKTQPEPANEMESASILGRNSQTPSIDDIMTDASAMPEMAKFTVVHGINENHIVQLTHVQGDIDAVMKMPDVGMLHSNSGNANDNNDMAETLNAMMLNEQSNINNLVKNFDNDDANIELEDLTSEIEKMSL